MRVFLFFILLNSLLFIACQQPKTTQKNSLDLANQFVHILNFHQKDSLIYILSDNIRFQDAQNRVLQGKARVVQGWHKYWTLFPDYHISIDDIFIQGNKIAIFGTATATYLNKQTDTNENQWSLPIAWHLTLQNNQVREWKMYGDTKIIYEIIQQNENVEQ